MYTCTITKRNTQMYKYTCTNRRTLYTCTAGYDNNI